LTKPFLPRILYEKIMDLFEREREQQTNVAASDGEI